MGQLGTDTGLSGAVKPSNIEVDGYEGDLFAHRFCEIPTNLQMRIAYVAAGNGAGQAEYVGYAPRGLAEGTDGWVIHKFTYDASDRTTERNIAYGNWTNRASETYA